MIATNQIRCDESNVRANRFNKVNKEGASERERTHDRSVALIFGAEMNIKRMRGAQIVLLAPLVAGLAISTNSTSARRRPERAPASAEVEHGRYLVEEVAKCPECHTPRNDRGELRQEAWLSGASIWIQPVDKIRNWADRAPALAGFPSFTEQQGERILEKGTGPEGEEIRPPMHIYHMNHADAKAIIAYLKSLPRSQSPN